MKKNYLSMFMAIAMIASGASFFSSCEKTPAGNEGENTENNGGNQGGENQGGENQGGGNQEEGTYIDVKAGEDLQTAIFNAPKGAIVRVQGGVTFEGNIKFVEGVTLSGGWNSTFTECGAEDLENLTIIDAKGSGRALEQHRIKPEGSDAYADFKTLQSQMELMEPAILTHPVWGTRRVYLTELKSRMEPKENYVAYSFEFREVDSSGKIPK